MIALRRLTLLVLSAQLVSATATPRVFAQSDPEGASSEAPAPPPLPPPAPPTAVGDDMIVLKNGGMIRGTLVDVVPQSHARIQLATGEISKVPWAAIARVERGDERAGAPADVKPPPAAEASGGTVTVYLRSPTPVTLEARARDGHEWRPVCVNRCSEPLSREASYRFVGPGMRPSSVFRLEANAGEATYLAVDPASKSGLALGIVGTSVGGVSIMVGALMALIGAAESYTYSTDSSGRVHQDSADKDLQTAGLITLLAGGVLTTVGILGIVNNAHSKVQQSVHDPGNGSDEARRPEWRARPRAELAAVPATTQLPILNLSF